MKAGVRAALWSLLGALSVLALVQAGLLLYRPTPLGFYVVAMLIGIGALVLWALQRKVARTL